VLKQKITSGLSDSEREELIRLLKKLLGIDIQGKGKPVGSADGQSRPRNIDH